MRRVKENLINWKDYERDHFYKAGNAMDEHGRGGFRAILADVLVELGSFNAAKEKGLVRSEGKEYVVQDGDIMHFRFNV